MRLGSRGLPGSPSLARPMENQPECSGFVHFVFPAVYMCPACKHKESQFEPAEPKLCITASASVQRPRVSCVTCTSNSQGQGNHELHPFDEEYVVIHSDLFGLDLHPIYFFRAAFANNPGRYESSGKVHHSHGGSGCRH